MQLIQIFFYLLLIQLIDEFWCVFSCSHICCPCSWQKLQARAPLNWNDHLKAVLYGSCLELSCGFCGQLWGRPKTHLFMHSLLRPSAQEAVSSTLCPSASVAQWDVTGWAARNWYSSRLAVMGRLFTRRGRAYSQLRPSILSGSVNEDQLWLGRQRQVWFILLVDKRMGMQVKSLDNACHTVALLPALYQLYDLYLYLLYHAHISHCINEWCCGAVVGGSE